MFIFRRPLETRLASARATLETLRSDAIAESDAIDEQIAELARRARIADDVAFDCDDMLGDGPDNPPTIINMTESEGF